MTGDRRAADGAESFHHAVAGQVIHGHCGPPYVSTKLLGVSSAREELRAARSALALNAEVGVHVAFDLEERLNRFICRLSCGTFVSSLIQLGA
jgi:hypothetical protein